MSSKKEKKSSITLSIDSEVIELLKKEAEQKEISLNANINGVLSKFVLFYKYSEEYNSVVIVETVVRDYLNLIDENKFIQILDQFILDTLPVIFMHQNIILSLDNVIEFCFKTLAKWAGMYQSFRVIQNNSNINLIFEHKYGIKWSRILGNCFCHLIEKKFNYPTKLQIFQNSISINVEI